MSITKDIRIGELIYQRPDAIEILMNFGMGCVGWPSAQMETLEEAAMVHGLNIDDILAAINK